MTVCAPIVTSGSAANDFSSSQDMQCSRQIAVSSTPWRAHSALNSRCRSCSPGSDTQPVVQPVERGLLGGGRRDYRGGSGSRRSVDLDCGGAGDRPLQRHPPQPAGAFGEIAGDIDGEWGVELAQDGQRVVAVVAIAVVEREAGEAPREVAVGQPPMHFVDGNDVDADVCAGASAWRAGNPGSISR